MCGGGDHITRVRNSSAAVYVRPGMYLRIPVALTLSEVLRRV